MFFPGGNYSLLQEGQCFTLSAKVQSALSCRGFLRSMQSSIARSVSPTGRFCIGITLCSCLLGCSRGSHYYIDRGNRLYSEGKYQEAALNYRNSIKKEPNFAEAHYRLAKAELQERNGPEAFNEFQRAVNLAPDREDFRVDFADFALLAYSSDPRKPKVLYEHVLNTAEHLLKKDPNSIDGLRFRGDVLSIDGKY